MKIPGFLFVVLLSVLVSLPARATCPLTVSRIQNHINDEWVSRQLQTIYQEIGCATKFEAQQGKRGILLFNMEKMDGLAARIPRVEPMLARSFIRSTRAVANITGQIYSYNPADKLLDDQAQLDKPFAYTRGIIWQEKMGQTGAGISFDGTDQMYHAIRLKRIDRLMLSNFGMALSIRRGDLPHGAIAVGKVSLNAKLYHYLASQYRDIMQKIDQKITAWPDRFNPARVNSRE